MSTQTLPNTPLTVATLVPEEHSDRRAIVDGREGRLVWSTVPAYYRITVRCWYLVVPSRLEAFDEEALSLQWASSSPVVLL